ncbi:MAG: radical SAM protein, partial [Zoogloea sp.]|nr:radical SAM protein [Zoogloea sp.]
PVPRGDTDRLCLYLAHDCNLRCTYCYNPQGRNTAPGRMMSPAVAEAAFRRFFVTPGKRYAAAFYGGEPLLNFRAMRAIVKAGRQLEAERGITIAFSITTNGTLLKHEIEDFLAGHFDSVTLSLDGPQDIHDLHRRSPKGGSHARALASLERLQARCAGGGPRLTLKGTLARQGVARYEESLAYLAGLGTGGAILTPVEMSGGSEADLSDAEHADFVARHAALNAAAVDACLEGDAPEEARNIVANLLTRRRLRRHCNAGRDLAVAADGMLYACHGLVGQPDFAMGKVTDAAGTDFDAVQANFAWLEVDQVPACAGCWARYLCGGACYANAWHAHHDLRRPHERHCDLVRACSEAVIRRFLRVVADEPRRQRLYARVRELIGAGRQNEGCHA